MIYTLPDRYSYENVEFRDNNDGAPYRSVVVTFGNKVAHVALPELVRFCRDFLRDNNQEVTER